MSVPSLWQRKTTAHDLLEAIERIGLADVEDGVDVVCRDPRDNHLELHPLRLILHPLDHVVAELSKHTRTSIILKRVRWS